MVKMYRIHQRSLKWRFAIHEIKLDIFKTGSPWEQSVKPWQCLSLLTKELEQNTEFQCWSLKNPRLWRTQTLYLSVRTALGYLYRHAFYMIWQMCSTSKVPSLHCGQQPELTLIFIGYIIQWDIKYLCSRELCHFSSRVENIVPIWFHFDRIERCSVVLKCP